MKKISGNSNGDFKENNTKDTKQEENDLKEYCDEFLKQAKKNLKRLREDWEFTRDEYSSGLESKKIKSEYELKWEMKNIKQVARSYGCKYDDFLTELDREGKKLLKQGANYLLKEGINDIVGDVFDAFSDLSLSFNTFFGLALEYDSFKYSSFYRDLGRFVYDIPNELNDIKRWWKREYEKDPQVVKKRKKEEENNKIFLSEILGDLKEEQKIYKNEIKEIQEELEFERKKIEEECESLKNEQIDILKKGNDEIIADFQKNIELVEKENMIKEDELFILGILKFRQKNKLLNEIDINKHKIEKIRLEITNTNTDYKKKREEIIERFDNEYKKKILELEQSFKMPTNPKDIKEKISSIIKRNTPSLSKNKYRVTNSKCGLTDMNRNNSYSCARRKMYELIKRNRTINPNRKDKIILIKDLSKLRIYQILFSLEEDGLVSRSINNKGQIIFRVK